jgi:glycosyltransferase involved in cell wall biosynthesis
MFDPASPEEIAHVVARLWHDRGLRADLRRRGIKRAALFSWDDMARKTYDVYRRTASYLFR